VVCPQATYEVNCALRVSSAWKRVSLAVESQLVQLKSASQWGQKLLDTEEKDATLLEAATKQHTEDHDWEH
jgi:hypothetical protein